MSLELILEFIKFLLFFENEETESQEDCDTCIRTQFSSLYQQASLSSYVLYKQT